MPFKISAFRAHFAKHGDFSPTSKFDVRITAPPALGLLAGDLRFQCEATELPGYTINTVDNRYYGVANPVASFSSFADLNLTFVCAADLWEKKLFDRWMNLVVPINNYNPNYKDVYTAPKIEINQYTGISREFTELGESRDSFAPENQGFGLGMQNSKFLEFGSLGYDAKSAPPEIPPIEIGHKSYTVTFFEAFPTSIAPMAVNWADDSFHRLAVTFRYQYWTTGDLEQTAKKQNDGVPVTAPRAQTPAKASGSTPPVVGTKPTKQPAPPLTPFKGGKGGTFAGGGASGSF